MIGSVNVKCETCRGEGCKDCLYLGHLLKLSDGEILPDFAEYTRLKGEEAEKLGRYLARSINVINNRLRRIEEHMGIKEDK